MNTLLQKVRVKAHVLAVLFLLLLVCGVGLATVDDYGIASDEQADILSAFWNYRLVDSNVPIPETRTYYGTLIPFLGEVAYQAKSFVVDGQFDFYFGPGTIDADLTRDALVARISIKHRVIFLLSLLAYFACAAMVGELAGWRLAWLGVATLALIPRFWGNAFFDPKDIPFAVMYTLGTLVGAVVAERLSTRSPDSPPSTVSLAMMVVLFGILTGLVTATRIAGCVLLASVLLTHFVLTAGRRQTIGALIASWKYYAGMAIAWSLTVIVLHPASWTNPMTWLVNALLSASNYQWDGLNLFRGNLVPALDPPRSYLPVWFGITTPVAILVLALAGSALTIGHYRNSSTRKRAIVWMLLQQVSLLPIVGVLSSSTMYDSIRQFLFMVPPIAVLAAVALAWLSRWIQNSKLRLLAGLTLVFLAFPTIAAMIRLHPYEYTFFNVTVGGLGGAYTRFDTDYWGLSLREAMEWIDKEADPGARVVSTRPYISSESYARPDLDMLRMHEFDATNVPRPYYALILNRYEYYFGEEFEDCSIVHRVIRDGASLSTVRYCGPS